MPNGRKTLEDYLRELRQGIDVPETPSGQVEDFPRMVAPSSMVPSPPKAPTKNLEDYLSPSDIAIAERKGWSFEEAIGRFGIDISLPPPREGIGFALDIISGKYKTAFMKEISGVAISEQEAIRLGNLVPNIKLQDTRFESSAKDAQDSLVSDLIAAASRFGFNSIDEMREGLVRTKAGEFYDIDQNIIGGSNKINEGGMSDEEAYQLYLNIQ